MCRPQYEPDAEDQEEASAVRSDPQGGFLLAPRLPWLVRYRRDTLVPGRVLREIVHRPKGSGDPSNVAAGGTGATLFLSYGER